MAKKIIKAKIGRAQSAYSTHYTYPSAWMVNKQRIQVIAYETSDKEGTGVATVQGRGNTDEYVLGYVDEKYVPELVADKDIEQLTKAEAETFMTGWIVPKKQITDETAVLTVTAKAALGQELTKEEKDVLDPNSDVPGINMSESLSDILTKIEAKHGTISDVKTLQP